MSLRMQDKSLKVEMQKLSLSLHKLSLKQRKIQTVNITESYIANHRRLS